MKMHYTCTNSIFIFINITAESLNFVGGGAIFVDCLYFTGSWGRNILYFLIYLQKYEYPNLLIREGR